MVLTSPPAPHPPAEAAAVVDAYEETHVHGVYEAIASHFSATRHKPWPLVTSFLASQPPGSVGLDVGCGNGKNMGVNGDVLMLGCDRSAALVALARDSGADVAVADSLALPFREGSADFAICIAVIHHLSTRERRVDAIRQLLRKGELEDEVVAAGGRVISSGYERDNWWVIAG
ncbi:hypothetical protein VPNG_08769 [Cytospora leucostoma]|uniref:Methyltransferase type 11 domain-containing protein n=1 Tax=Cytospora leucostoma TaxID=1230097 RepID=A0A423VXL9_9PEZI|nr:hypothetical protein VPNG_08769 [Cytospora leucostoma]